MNCMLDELRQRTETHHPRQLDIDQRLLQAAMLVPITRSDDPELMLILCAAGLSVHGGEVTFPGGWRDPEDANLVCTALREAEEEITLPSGLVEVVGPLSILISRYNIEVTPHVAFIPDFVKYQPSDGGIAAVFNVPLSFFRDDPREITHHIDCFGHSWHVSSYRFGEFKVWGLTAIMVAKLVNLLYDDPIDLYTPPTSLIRLS